MNVRVCVPFRGGDPDRDAAWAYLRPLWKFPIVEGHDSGEPFSKAAAMNDAARGEWDVAILADADTFAPSAQVEGAVRVAHQLKRAVWPFRLLHRLTPEGTQQVYAGRPLDRVARSATATYAPGGIVIVPRFMWDRVQGFDERFRGWGGEDNAFVSSIQAIHPVVRTAGPAFHLWHPHAPTRYKGPEYAANLALSRRYAAARRAPSLMAALIAER